MECEKCHVEITDENKCCDEGTSCKACCDCTTEKCEEGKCHDCGCGGE